jgi:RNA polymerase subunit RPABC4/transcription elongation factor Spt4
MPVRNDNSTSFIDELRIISRWAYFFAFLVFFTLPILFAFLARFDKTNPPMAVGAFAGLIAGTFTACFVLLVGYVNRDAGRRCMSRVLWTLLAIFIPNALGIVLYFVLRKPRTANCPQCGSVVEPGFSFCPRCRHRLAPVCSQCKRSVNAGDTFCPYCGADVVPALNA